MDIGFWYLLLWSAALGAFLCAVYDLFRLLRLHRSGGAVSLFFADLLFCIVAAVSMTVLFFNLSYGRMRALPFAFAVFGFLAWRFTVSRVVMSAIDRLLSLVSRLLSRLKARLLSSARRALSRSRTYVYIKSTVRGSKSCFGMKGHNNERKDTGKD